MEKQMVQCEDGRRRQARIHGGSREDGDFKIWKAAVRVKGKHVSGEAWYSQKTKTWYFLTNPEGKHSQLLYRSQEDSFKKMQKQLDALKARQTKEWNKLAEHRKNMAAIEAEIKAIEQNISNLMKRMPVESSRALERSSRVKIS